MNSMKQSERRAVVARLISTMKDEGSWVGNTHVQKCVYFLQELFDVPTGYKFVIYKHGPFSFELRDELTFMRADLLLDIELRHPYGPSFTMGYHDISDRNGAPDYDDAIKFVGEEISDKDTRLLERLSTALFVQAENPDMTEGQVSRRISELKPHIPVPTASAAVREVSELRKKAESVIMARA